MKLKCQHNRGVRGTDGPIRARRRRDVLETALAVMPRSRLSTSRVRGRQEPVNGPGGVILDYVVAEVGDNGGLIDEWAGEGLGRTGVEPPAVQWAADQRVDKALRPDLQRVGDPEQRPDIRQHNTLRDDPLPGAEVA